MPTLLLAAALAFGWSGCGSSETAGLDDVSAKAGEAFNRAGLAPYRLGLEQDSAELVEDVTALGRAIEADDLAGARSSYWRARVHYGHVKPIATRMLPDLDARIEGSSDSPSSNRSSGFRGLEEILFARGKTDEAKLLVGRLLADVERLEDQIPQLELGPREAAAAATQVLAGVPATMIAERVGPHANNDLVDVAAAIEGGEAGFYAVRPLLVEKNPALVGVIEAALDRAYDRLQLYGTPARDPVQAQGVPPGTVFVFFSDLSEAEVAELATPIAKLAKLLSRLPNQFNAKTAGGGPRAEP